MSDSQWAIMASTWQRSWQTNDIDRSEAFEPWLGGDRQMMGGVAKTRDPNANGLFEVSLS
ncbi:MULTISPECIES: hypothetical protein [unclassified Bradyrhizobium]|uniref:hypothetical protein n=1 Tax=unclassified Bradyrhizobium TaxID=2631580 RepID=UPI002FF11B28